MLHRLRGGKYTLIYSEPLLDELLAKLVLPRIRDRYAIDDEAITALIALLTLCGELVAPDRKVKVCRDSKDDMVIEAALAGAAEVVVTGDDDLLTLNEFEGIRFITPRDFLTAF